jgi:hypothetical protein
MTSSEGSLEIEAEELPQALRQATPAPASAAACMNRRLVGDMALLVIEWGRHRHESVTDTTVSETMAR